MLVVDASCLYEVLLNTAMAAPIAGRLTADPDLVAPHVIDVEILGAIRRDRMLGRLDETEARQALTDLADWGGERFGHRALLPRAWELRDTVRAWDAMYVALAEALDATLLTMDARLAHASGPRCSIEVPNVTQWST